MRCQGGWGKVAPTRLHAKIVLIVILFRAALDRCLLFLQITDELEEKKDHEEPKLLSDEDEPVNDSGEKRMIVQYDQKALSEEKLADSKEITLWDFAGQQLYYAMHSVFLSGRAVYVLVYNLNKNLLATAEPCVRQGFIDISLDNPNDETNLDNLLSWLALVHNIRSTAKENVVHQGKRLPYLRPPVIIVGTHLDQPFEGVNTMEQHIKEGLAYKKCVQHLTAPFFAVDNTTENDEGVQKLRQRIIEILKEEPYMGEEVPLRYEGRFI